MIENKNQPGIRGIASKFRISGEISSVTPYGSGHINDTYYLQNALPDSTNYLLQKINHRIFKDVQALMANISAVIDHLKKKLASIPDSQPDKEVMTLVRSTDDELFYKDPHGNYWRMYQFLENTRSYDIIESTIQAQEGGKAFGRFQSMLMDLDIQSLYYTIPDFHNLEKRVADFNQAISADPFNRKKDVLTEIGFLSERSDKMICAGREQVEATCPKRITHNDTKFNNILLDPENKAQCIVDLDTVMPGYLANDFGDAMRTLINTANEDEADLENIQLNIPFFEAYTRGYLTEVGAFISPAEIESLSVGMLMLPYMQSIRFLTDYLNGDIYYKINDPAHNLQRTRAQMELLRKLEGQMPVIRKIIRESAKICS